MRTGVELGFSEYKGWRTLHLFGADTWEPSLTSLSLTLHVQPVSKSCQLQLHNTFRIQPFLTTSTATTIAQATMSCHLDNCKNLLTFPFPISHAPSPHRSILHTAVSQGNIYHLTREGSHLLLLSYCMSPLLKSKLHEDKVFYFCSLLSIFLEARAVPSYI